MNTPNTADAANDAYLLVSIARVRSPIDADDRNWHRYVIAQGNNQIVGHRSGTPDEARRAVEELIVQLNSRRDFKPKRVQIALGKK